MIARMFCIGNPYGSKHTQSTHVVSLTHHNVRECHTSIQCHGALRISSWIESYRHCLLLHSNQSWLITFIIICQTCTDNVTSHVVVLNKIIIYHHSEYDSAELKAGQVVFDSREKSIELAFPITVRITVSNTRNNPVRQGRTVGKGTNFISNCSQTSPKQNILYNLWYFCRVREN